MPNIGIVSLNNGKVTPLIRDRSDVEKHSSSLAQCQNMIPRIYGPLERRPGTKYVANVDDNGVVSRMIPFIFSSTVAYELEFGDQVINVYFDDSLVTSVVTPYLEADLFELQFDQLADVMWLTHNDYNPRKLTRTTATTFSLDKIPFEDGPFIKRNDLANDDKVNIRAVGTTIATATAGVAGSGSFTITDTTDNSSLYTVNQRFYVTGSTANDNAYTVKSATFSSPTLTIVPNENVPDGTDDGEIMINGGEVTLIAQAGTPFTTGIDGHVDSLWKLTHKRLVTTVNGTATGTGVIGDPIDVKGAWTFTTTGNWGATVEIQRLADGTNWETFRTYISTISSGQGSFNAQKSDVEEGNGVQYRINVTSYTGGTVEATFLVDNSTQDSIFKITSVNTTINATATAIIAAPDNVKTKRWAEGSWSNVRGWPRSITFFDERAVYGFTESDNRTVWLSEVGETENFEAGVNDSDSFALVLPTTNSGKWLGSLEALAAGTSGGEWRIRSTAFDQALTPTNFSIKQQSDFGSANIQAMSAGDAIIFVDAVARKIREYTWSEGKQKYVAPDLTALAEDITSGGITSMAVQRHPDSILWFTIANSPYLISMTYEREQNVVAFAEHPLGGSGIAESVCVTPGSAEDKITLTAKRTINNKVVRFIETMQPRDWGDDTDIFFVDAGVIDTSGSTTITGLGHLEGETVQVMVDGAKQADKVVQSAQITIDEAGDRAVVGLSYEYIAEPLRANIATAAGTSHGSIMKTPEIVVSFFKTLNARYGDGDTDYGIDWRTTENYDSPPDLFTGDKTLSFDGGFTVDNRIVISGSDPFPCTVRAIILRTDKTGR
jgi:hypothetical protein